jgi:hypothetical protein
LMTKIIVRENPYLLINRDQGVQLMISPSLKNLSSPIS